MEFITEFFGYFSNLGSAVMVPIVITIIGLVVGLKFSKALQSGMLVGIGLIGLNLVLNLIWDNITPITQILVEKFDTNLTVLDIGWAAGAGLAYSTIVGSFIIPFTILVNVILLLTKLTKTANIDIWNYWHYAFTGSLIYVVTKSLPLSFIGAATHCILSLVFADLAAKKVQRALGIPGVSITGGEVTGMLPIVILMDKIYNLIFKKKNQPDESKDFDSSKYKFLGFLSQPIFLGAIIGILLSLLSGYKLAQTLNIAMAMAALMYLLPRMVKVLMEGFLPLSNQARDFMQKKFSNSGREIYIGLDSAVLLGLPTTISVGLLLIPITLLIAVILPGNKTLPLGDLPATGYMVAYATAFHASKSGKPNFWRTLITGIVIMPFVLWTSSAFAPMLTEVARASSMDIPVDAVSITCLEGNLFAYAIFKFLTMNLVPVGIVLCVLLSAGGILFSKWMQKKEDAELAADAAMEAEVLASEA